MRGSFWCDPWTAWPVRPTYALLWRSRPDHQTAAPLLTRLSPCTHNGTCCRATTFAHVYTYVHSCTLNSHTRALTRKARTRANCGSDKFTREHYMEHFWFPVLKVTGWRRLNWMKFTHGNPKCGERGQQRISTDKTSANQLYNPQFSFCCVQSCQLNHEGTVQCVSKSRINVMIWPIKLWNEVLHKLFCS